MRLTGLSTSLPPGSASGGYGKAAISAGLSLGSNVAVGLLMIFIFSPWNINREIAIAARVVTTVATIRAGEDVDVGVALVLKMPNIELMLPEYCLA